VYLREVAVYGDPAIVTHFPSGFVALFHRDTCCITEWYRSLLRQSLQTPDTRKVNFTFTDQNGSTPAVRQLIDVADALWPFAFSEYVEQDLAQKKHMILEAMDSALAWIAKERHWDIVRLEECREAALRSDLTLEGWSKQSWTNPDGRYRIRVGFRFKLGTVDFYAGVFKRGREIGREPLGSVAPEMGVADPVMRGAGEWLHKNVFRLVPGRTFFHVPKVWEVDLSDLLV
jgi:hypothetical protein